MCVLHAGDRDELMLIFERLGAQSRVQRFLGPKPVLTERDRTIVTQVDGLPHAGVIAFAGSRAQPVGAAHCVGSHDGVTVEVAIEVVDTGSGAASAGG